MKVLVCGGAGYIASHTVRQIQRQTNWEVVILDNFSTGHWGTIPSNIVVELGDIRDDAFHACVFKKHKPDAVMHFCASIVVPDSVRDPLGYYDNNVVGSQRLLKAMVDHKCLQFIFSSTAALFGTPDRVPIHPMDTKKPDSPYGDTKLIIEGLLQSCHVAYGMRFVCLRYFNACGADPSGEVGERHEPETHLVPVVIEAALGKRKQISIFGTDFPTRDGSCVRDYIHVNDLASAHIAALKYLQKPQNPPGYFNLGSGVGYTVKEIVQAVEQITNKKLNVVLAGRREGDPAELVADPSLANEVLGWKPTFSLKEIVETAYRFHKKLHTIDLELAPFEQDERYASLIRTLRRHDQLHLFQHWSPDDAKGEGDRTNKIKFLDQLRIVDHNYPGGIDKYLHNSRSLLAKTRDGYNPWETFKPSNPAIIIDSSSSTELFDKTEQAALDGGMLRRCGFVLVAGGLGERLGYDGIKIEIPVESVTLQSHLEFYVAHIQAWRRHGATTQDETTTKIPLCIMTSDDTHDLTLKLLAKLRLDGLVDVLKQEKVPALGDNHAKLCLSNSSPFALDTKPHGNGDVHGLLHRSGVAAKWLNQFGGLDHIVFIQDTNSLAMKSVPFAVAQTSKLGLDMGFVCIPRAPGSAIGCIVQLTNGRRTLVSNVEYNVLDSFLKSASGGKSGDVAGPNGFSPFPGNTNTLVLNLRTYVSVLEKTHGALPEYVAPKYAPGSGRNAFISPTRLECGMEDISQLMPDPSKVGAIVFSEQFFFNPVKANRKDAAAKIAAGLPPWSALHSEAQLYGYNVASLRYASADIPDGTPEQTTVHVGGPLSVHMPPRVVLAPSWLPVSAAAKRKIIQPLRISPQSTLVVDGELITFEKVDLDGVLIIKAVRGADVTITGVKCRSPPWLIAAAKGQEGSSSSGVIGVKGFVVVKRGEPVVLNFPKPGKFVYNGSNTPSRL